MKLLAVEMRVFVDWHLNARRLSMGDVLKFDRMSVEEIRKKLLREPFVCQMLTTEYKSVVNISDYVKLLCMDCQGILVLLKPLMPQVVNSNIGQ